MAENGRDVNKSKILYELLLLSEWIEDHDSVISKNSLNSTTQESTSYFNFPRLFSKNNIDKLRFLQTEYPWHLAVSKDGKVVAVLQETLLEIKTAKDEYSSTVGKACIPHDQYPKLRKLSWSPDNSLVSIARDNGVIYVFNLFGCNIATVKPSENTNEILQPVVGLCFIHPKFKSTKWSNELLVVYHRGDVKSILLSSLDGQESDENIKFSLNSYYPNGISSVVYDQNHLLIVAGIPSKSEHGITVWRILNDYPFLKCAFEIEKFSAGSRSLLRFLPGFSNYFNPKTVYKMSISPDGKLLASLHFSGDICLWRVPGTALYKKWSLQDQPQFDKCNPESNEPVKEEKSFYPVDVAWWSNEALVIARRNGALTVCSISTLENLLGDSPEFLANSPQIFCTEGLRSGVIALECEMACNYKTPHFSNENNESETSVLQESIQAALYSFTDIERFEPKRKAPKVTQRTYRLVALKRTTPEELYSRKIDNEEYEEALLLARKYNLDCDLVYQKRWRNSNASKESIHNYLKKVNKVSWVVNECVERVPDALEDARELLEFGLKKTDLKLSVDDLSVEARQLVLYRKQLLRFSDSLTLYEKIIGSLNKYNSIEYGEFRKQEAIVATVNFARQENWQAVSIMFTYLGDKVLPHWLPILSNFPETLNPLHYRSLLPEIVDNQVVPWEKLSLRDSDWSEMPPFQSLGRAENSAGEEIFYESNARLKEFQAESITTDVAEEWYKKRTYEIEENTGLVENALSLVVLARKRGLKTLNKLHGDLMTLESLVYIVGDENVTLKNVEALSHYEQSKLLMSKTVKTSFVTDLKNLIVPFSGRCEEQNCHSSYSLLREILLHFSEISLDLPCEILNYLKEGYLNPFPLTFNEMISIVLDCIYLCPKADQLETCFLILECLPQRTISLSQEEIELHDRIDKVEIHLEICEILGCYQIPKSVRFIYENEGKEEVGKQLMNDMADYTKRDIVGFTELLSNLETIRSNAFTCIPESYCYELYALTQMTCENEEIIQWVEDLLECRKGERGKMIPFEKSVELVLEAAKIHFEKAINFDDHYIHLARTCLRLIGEPHPRICEELDLIEAIQLLGDFEVNILPLQVRKLDQRMNLIQVCLGAKPKNYKSCERLLQLAQNLRIYGEDRAKREGEVLMMVAECALNYSDYQFCSEVCGRLISRNFSPAWTVVKELARKETYDNKANKLFFLAFAILHCPIENAEELIESRVKLHEKHFDEIMDD